MKTARVKEVYEADTKIIENEEYINKKYEYSIRVITVFTIPFMHLLCSVHNEGKGVS